MSFDGKTIRKKKRFCMRKFHIGWWNLQSSVHMLAIFCKYLSIKRDSFFLGGMKIEFDFKIYFWSMNLQSSTEHVVWLVIIYWQLVYTLIVHNIIYTTLNMKPTWKNSIGSINAWMLITFGKLTLITGGFLWYLTSLAMTKSSLARLNNSC